MWRAMTTVRASTATGAAALRGVLLRRRSAAVPMAARRAMATAAAPPPPTRHSSGAAAKPTPIFPAGRSGDLFAPSRHAQAAWARGKAFKPRRPRDNTNALPMHQRGGDHQQQRQRRHNGGGDRDSSERPQQQQQRPPVRRQTQLHGAADGGLDSRDQQRARALLAAASRPLPAAAPVEEWNARLAQLAHSISISISGSSGAGAAGGGMARLLSFLRDMLRMSNVKPNVRTYAIVFDAITRSGRTDWPLEQALSLLRAHPPARAADNAADTVTDGADADADALLDAASADEALDRSGRTGDKKDAAPPAAAASASRVQFRAPLPRTLVELYAIVLRALSGKRNELTRLWTLYTELTTAAVSPDALPRLPALPADADLSPLHLIVMDALSRNANAGSTGSATNSSRSLTPETVTTAAHTQRDTAQEQLSALLVSRMWHIVNVLSSGANTGAAQAAASTAPTNAAALATAVRLLASACARRGDTDALARVHERAAALGLPALTDPLNTNTYARLHRLQLSADTNAWRDVDAQLAAYYTHLSKEVAAAAAAKPAAAADNDAAAPAAAAADPAKAAAAADADLLPAAGRAALGEAYGIAIRGLARAGEWRTVLQRFDDVQRGLFGCDVDTFNAVLDCVGRARQYDALERVFWWVFSRDVRTHRPELAAAAPDLQSFKHMCLAFANVRGDTANVHKYLRIMRASRRLSPDVSLYNVVLKAHVDRGEVELIVQRMQLMRSEGVEPDTVSYNTLLKACTARDDTRALLHYFGEMKQVHTKQKTARADAEAKRAVATNVGTGEAPTGAAAAAPAAAPAATVPVDLSAPLPAITVTPDMTTYTILIQDRLKPRYGPATPLTEQQAARRADKYGDQKGQNKWTRKLLDDPNALADVTKWLKEMKDDHKLVPDAVCYNALLVYFSRRRDLANMQRYYFLMRSAGVRPTMVNYNTLVGGLAHEHDVFAMLEHVNEMRSLGMAPSGYVYSTLLGEYARRLDVVSVLRVWDEMHADAAKLHARSADGGGASGEEAAAGLNAAAPAKAAAAAASASPLPAATTAALRDLTPNRLHWHAIVPHFTTAQLGVSERVALAAKHAWSVYAADLPGGSKARAARYSGSKQDTSLNAKKLEALYAFIEELRAQKWTM